MEAILVTGARIYDNQKLIYDTLSQFANLKIVLIHGDCDGVDKLAANIGTKLGLDVRAFPVTPADWEKFGRAAGPIRNKKMIDYLLTFKKRHMFAFHDNIANSKGTKDCVNQAKKNGINAK